MPQGRVVRISVAAASALPIQRVPRLEPRPHALLQVRDEVTLDARLDRDFGRKRWGDAGCACEELVAELGAAFLCADLGLTPNGREDHASYIASWLDVLKNDKRFAFTAAVHAQRAVDYLHGLQPTPTT